MALIDDSCCVPYQDISGTCTDMTIPADGACCVESSCVDWRDCVQCLESTDVKPNHAEHIKPKPAIADRKYDFKD